MLKMPRSSSGGVIMVLLVLLVPIVFAGVRYSQTLLDRRQKILELNAGYYRKYDPAKVALIAAKAWDPLKTLGQQNLNSIYEAAFDSGIWCQNSTIGGAIDGIISENSSEDTTSGIASSSSGPADAPPTSAGKMAWAKKDITIAIENDKIKVVANNKSAYALPKECNLDLVLAIPTNSAAAVAEIGKASANFLKDNFYYTRGVYASVIPYSGKLSLPSGRYDGWTESLPNLKPAPYDSNNPLTLYDLYGTKSFSGTTATTYNSAGSSNGYSIMSRSSLFDATNASSSKYRRMNIAPCTSFVLTSAHTIASPVYTTYTANPHAIMEPVSDLSTAYTKCNGLTLPSDSKNTSSFAFAALEWANNMFQTWTTDPQKSAVAGGDSGILSSPAKTTSGRKKAIILIVNKPDTFASGEMTYLGLSNDADQKYVSDELGEWKATTLPSPDNWISVCYGDGKFVAVAEDTNAVAYSTNGINWTASTMPSNIYWYSVCYGGGKFVAFADSYSNKAAYSTDGINWTESTLPSSAIWYSVYCGDGKFVAVADSYSNKAACGEFIVKSNAGLGNTALKSALGDGSSSGVTTLTTQACTKLKSAYGDNIRIYVVKYRKSSGDYAYLDTCATSMGGKSYDISDSTALKTTLNTIAADLKSWAGYTEARVVD